MLSCTTVFLMFVLQAWWTSANFLSIVIIHSYYYFLPCAFTPTAFFFGLTYCFSSNTVVFIFLCLKLTFHCVAFYTTCHINADCFHFFTKYQPLLNTEKISGFTCRLYTSESTLASPCVVEKYCIEKIYKSCCYIN